MWMPETIRWPPHVDMEMEEAVTAQIGNDSPRVNSQSIGTEENHWFCSSSPLTSALSTTELNPSFRPLPTTPRIQEGALRRRAGKMSESMAARYWCHMCSQLVNPITEVELQCPHCDSGFVEEVDGREDVDDQTLSPWAPILLRMLGGGSLRRRRIHREVERESSDREVEAFRRRRRRTPAMLQMLHALREGNRSEPGRIDVEREHGRGTEHVILINPFAQALILQGSSDADQLQGPGLELLLQHLAENDPDRYGTPPALKEAVDAMPTVRIEKKTSCSICLEDMEVGGEATEMPCKHKFHGGCILPWLKLHSSCPVCRFQMPADGPKATSAGGSGNRAAVGDGRSVPWPLDGFFPLSASRSSSNSSFSPPPSSSTSGSSSQPNEN
ncbi:unnamed protein product [Musa hybrid cultivar]